MMRLISLLFSSILVVACAGENQGDPDSGGAPDARTGQGFDADPAVVDAAVNAADAAIVAADAMVGDTTDAASSADLTALSDELDDPATMSEWRVLHVEENRPAQHSTLAIHTIDSGHLTLVPLHSGWYADTTGPLVYKEVQGNFLVQVRVAAGNVNDHSQPPSQEYNAAGILVRDPASVPGDQNWLAHNLGYQSNAVGVGSEAKTTVESGSTLYLHPGARSGRLAVCRLGDVFHMLRWLDDETGWTETNTFTRADLPDRLQVGMMANGWTPPPDLYATFDWIRFAPVQSLQDCMVELTASSS